MPMDVFSVDQVARRFGVTHNTVREWCKRGKLKGERLGKIWVVPRSALVGFQRPRMGRPRTRPVAVAPVAEPAE